MTTAPIVEYLTHKATIDYLLYNSTLAGTRFHLLGVFLDNPWPKGINGSLWTLPIEVRLYLGTAVLGYLALLKSRNVFNLFFIIIILLYLQSPKEFFLLEQAGHVRVSFYYLLGAFFYINSKYIPLNSGLLAILGGFAIIFYKTPYYDFFFAIVFVYAVLLFAYHPKLHLRSLEKVGDFSYGIYLYSFPIQQLVIKFFGAPHPLLVLTYSIAIIFPLAAVSWFYIEKPALALKGKFKYKSWFRIKDSSPD